MLSPFVLRVVAAADGSRAGQELPVGGPATIGARPHVHVRARRQERVASPCAPRATPAGPACRRPGKWQRRLGRIEEGQRCRLEAGRAVSCRDDDVRVRRAGPGRGDGGAAANRARTPAGRSRARTGTTRTASSPSAGDRWPAHPSPCDHRRRSRRGRPRVRRRQGRGDHRAIGIVRHRRRRQGRLPAAWTHRADNRRPADRRSRQRRRRLARDEPGLGGVCRARRSHQAGPANRARGRGPRRADRGPAVRGDGRRPGR